MYSLVICPPRGQEGPQPQQRAEAAAARGPAGNNNTLFVIVMTAVFHAGVVVKLCQDAMGAVVLVYEMRPI